MMVYKHTQIGYLIIYVSLAVVIYFGIILFMIDFEPVVSFVVLFIMLILTSFMTLQVTIDKNYLRLKFGYGIYKNGFKLKEISSVRVVRNHWYNGWGIRVWFWPYMLIYNVSGFEAVEIKMKNGKIYRIGTDEPKKLNFALNQAIQAPSFAIKSKLNSST